MIHKRIASFFLALSLVHMPLTHTFNATEYAKAAYEYTKVTVAGLPGVRYLQHPFVFVPLSVVTIVGAAYIAYKIRQFKKFINTEPLEYDIIRGYPSSTKECIDQIATVSSARIDADKTVTAIDAASPEPVINSVTEPPVIAAEATIATIEPEDANDDARSVESVEQKTLVTIEMTPLYDQSNGSYDAYLQ
jgi:hypothetical protein